jgi:hypothetical protein
VFGVTDDAAGSPYLVVYHRHDGVIGNAAFVWTVVVHDVARPEPAFLHSKSPEKSNRGRGRTNSRFRPFQP